MKVRWLEVVHFRVNKVSTRMSERLRTETRTVAWSDRAVLRRTDIRSELVTRSGSRPLLG